MGISNNNQLNILDIMSVINFVIGIKNLQENIEQGGIQDILERYTKDIHNHLSIQDKKIDELFNLIGGNISDNKRNI